MQKILELGKTSTVGSFQLFLGVALSTVIMAAGTIILARLMTPEEYGLYSIAFIPSNMAVLFRDWGVNSAVTKYTASLRTQNRMHEARAIIAAGTLFEIISGLVITVILIGLSAFVATAIFKRPESATLIAIASTTIITGAVLTASQSCFAGFERMGLISLTNIVQAIVKTVASPFLVILGLSALGATLGYTLAFGAAAAISLFVLYLKIIRRLKSNNPQKTSFTQTLKGMLSYGFPLSVSAIIGGFILQFYSFMMVIYCTDVMIGNYQVATQFATLLTFVTTPISTVLFPTFSKIKPQEESELLQTVFLSSAKYTALVLVPTTAAMMVLSEPMVSTVFGEKWIYAPYFLVLYVIGNFYALFGNLSLGSFLSGVGETKFQMKLSIIHLVFGVLLAFLLIPSFGIVGLIIGSIASRAPAIFIGLYWVWKNYKAKVNFASSFKILFASVIAAAAAFLAISLTAFADWIELAIGGSTFIATYLTLAPLIGAITSCDIKNLKVLFSGLGLISKILNIPLAVMEKLSDAVEMCS
ncbi:MAG: flippase [Candidatus Bathyarchaeales archaeon]